MSAPSKERMEWMSGNCRKRTCQFIPTLGEWYCKSLGESARCFPGVGRPDCPALAEMPESDDYARGLEDGRREGREALNVVRDTIEGSALKHEQLGAIDAQRAKLEGK